MSLSMLGILPSRSVVRKQMFWVQQIRFTSTNKKPNHSFLDSTLYQWAIVTFKSPNFGPLILTMWKRV
ncbi:hypothetical protein IF2G_03713 [Cordyceps javanica]|nr:hypothetical protein IF2G_03713 [Cordyceps javanica]